MTTKLPKGVKLGKDMPGEVLSDSEWNLAADTTSTFDERAQGEDIQPGDTVIELKDGKPIMYTAQGGSANASSR
ncbi:MAG TPA: hypothetical protein VGR71_11825 [Nitrospira sp.]|nr:hypothetical protein [Nitrospira sp.]